MLFDEDGRVLTGSTASWQREEDVPRVGVESLLDVLEPSAMHNLAFEGLVSRKECIDGRDQIRYETHFNLLYSKDRRVGASITLWKPFLCF